VGSTQESAAAVEGERVHRTSWERLNMEEEKERRRGLTRERNSPSHARREGERREWRERRREEEVTWQSAMTNERIRDVSKRKKRKEEEWKEMILEGGED
jgi:hypothetical protein